MKKEKTSVCHCNDCTKDLKHSRYFMGVTDIEIKIGSIDNMEVYDTCRLYNDKFVNSPELALLVALDSRNERWKVNPKSIMKDVVFIPETKEWRRTYLETLNGHTPSEKQKKKWERGEYDLRLITEYIQIVETDLVGDENMISRAIATWNERKEKILNSCKKNEKEVKDARRCYKQCQCNE